MTSTGGVTAQLGIGGAAVEVTDWFQQQLLTALSDPLFNIPKAFETWMVDRVAMAGLNIPLGQVVGYGQTTQTVLVSKSSAQSISSATVTLVTWNAEVYDKPDDSMHDTSANNSRLTCRVAGRYLASAIVEWTASAAGVYKQAQLYVNGSPMFVVNQPTIKDAGTETILPYAFPPLDLSDGDYVELYVAQDTGGALNMLNTYSRFGLARIA